MNIEELFMYVYKLGYEDRDEERSYDPHSHAIPEVDYESKLHDINDKQPDIGSLVVGYHNECGMLLGKVIYVYINEDEPSCSYLKLLDDVGNIHYLNKWQPVFKPKE